MGRKFVKRLVILTLVSLVWDGIFLIKPQWIIAKKLELPLAFHCFSEGGYFTELKCEHFHILPALVSVVLREVFTDGFSGDLTVDVSLVT